MLVNHMSQSDTYKAQAKLERGSVLDFFLALRSDPKSVHEVLQNIADIQAAWEEFITSLGIEPETMVKAVPQFGAALELIDELLPDPDHENVKILIDSFNEIFDLTIATQF